MKKEKIKNIIAIMAVIFVSILVLAGCGKKEDNNKTEKNTIQNQTTSIENKEENTASKEEKNNTTKEDSTKNSSASESTTKNKATTPGKLVVNREGMTDEVTSKEHSSSMGYTMRYATDYFKASHHDDADWFEDENSENCVVVEKENKSYSKAIASVSNYKKTTVNGYEAVYTSRFVEGQHENKYYVNTGSDSTYIITTSCQGDTEHMEGLEHIMTAMVQTFATK